jgi:hypothetical protein
MSNTSSREQSEVYSHSQLARIVSEDRKEFESTAKIRWSVSITFQASTINSIIGWDIGFTTRSPGSSYNCMALKSRTEGIDKLRRCNQFSCAKCLPPVPGTPVLCFKPSVFGEALEPKSPVLTLGSDG